MFRVTISGADGRCSAVAAGTLVAAMHAVTTAATHKGLTPRYARHCACEDVHTGAAICGFLIDAALKPWFEFRIELAYTPAEVRP